MSIGPVGHAPSTVAVANHHDVLAGQEDVGRPDDAVDRRLPGAVVVVEQMLRRRVVDGHDRHPQGAVGSHRLESDDARGCLLRRADHLDVSSISVEECGQVGAIVHGDRRGVIQDRVDVLVIGVGILAADGKDRDALGDQGRGDVILSGQRVGCAQQRLSTTIAQCQHQVGGLGRDVEAGGDHETIQWLLLGKSLPHRRQDLHPAPGPCDPPGTDLGEGRVGYVVVHLSPSPIASSVSRSFRRALDRHPPPQPAGRTPSPHRP